MRPQARPGDRVLEGPPFQLARGCPTTQSGGAPEWSVSGAAVDGAPTGRFSFSTGHEREPWWRVDLGVVAPIARILVWNRTDAGLAGAERARPMVIEVSEDGAAWRRVLECRVVFGGLDLGRPLSFETLSPVRGRHLRIRLEREGWLHLDHVEVHLGAPPLRWASVTGASVREGRLWAESTQWHDSGFFSNCSTTLETLVQLRGWGFEPAEPDCSRIYLSYREHGEERDVHRDVFAHVPAIPLPPRGAMPEASDLFFTGHNHLHYRERDFAMLAPFMRRFFTPSASVRTVQERLAARAGYDPARTVAICWRGTDKHQEVPPTDIGEYIALADRLIASGEADRVLIQTDQAQARDAVVARFGSRCLFFDELPVSTGQAALHHTDLAGEHGLGRVEFARRLVAAVELVSRARHVVTHTGNVGLWIALFRGSADGLWQFDRDCRLVPPPGRG